jgi:hypothetical protein
MTNELLREVTLPGRPHVGVVQADRTVVKLDELYAVSCKVTTAGNPMRMDRSTLPLISIESRNEVDLELSSNSTVIRKQIRS